MHFLNKLILIIYFEIIAKIIDPDQTAPDGAPAGYISMRL